MTPACAMCDVPLEDDPHWHDIFQAWVCDDCCPCKSAVGGGSVARLSARTPDGDHPGLSASPAVVPAADGVPLPAYLLAELEAAAVRVRLDRLAWLATVALWVLVTLVGIEAAR